MRAMLSLRSLPLLALVDTLRANLDLARQLGLQFRTRQRQQHSLNLPPPNATAMHFGPQSMQFTSRSPGG